MVSRAATIRAAAIAAASSLLLALAPLGGTAAPAAAGNGLLVSTNGVDFTSDSTLPLFTRMGKVVPGDRSTRRIWLKNDSRVDAVLRVDLIDPSTDDAALASAFSLSVARRGAPPAPVTIADGVRNGACTVLRGGIALAPGESVRLDLTAGVASALSGRRGMRGSVRFRLRGVLVETAAAERAGPGDRCPEPSANPVRPPVPPPGSLPTTGPGAPLPLGLLGAAAIATGIVFCALAWRRREPAEEAGAGGDGDD